jgi:hypothetical protein
MNKNGKIYCLINKKTNEVRYVGFTRSSLNTRFSQHKHEALKRNTLSHVYNWFREIVKDNNTPIIKLLEDRIPIHLWEERENYWINKFKNLTNQKAGGNGVHLNTNSNGRISSINSKKKIVFQIDDNMNIIKEWSSSVEAEIFFNKKHTGNIFSSIKNGSKAFGFYWSKKENFKNTIPERKLEKKVFLYCLYTNKLIKEYKSKKELANDFCVAPSLINQAIKNNSIFKDFYYLRESDCENLENNYPVKKKIYQNNGKYYNNFNLLYKDSDFKYCLEYYKKIKEKFEVKIITNEIINILTFNKSTS